MIDLKLLGIFIWTCLVVLAASLFSYYGMHVCTRRTCYDKSNMVFEFMNTSADPCKNFHTFACGLPSVASNAPVLNTADTILSRFEKEVHDYLYNFVLSHNYNSNNKGTIGHMSDVLNKFFLSFQRRASQDERSRFTKVFLYGLKFLFRTNFPEMFFRHSTYNETTIADYEFKMRSQGLIGQTLFSFSISFLDFDNTDEKPVFIIAPPKYSIIQANEIKKLCENSPSAMGKLMTEIFEIFFKSDIDFHMVEMLIRTLYNIATIFLESMDNYHDSMDDKNNVFINFDNLKEIIPFIDWNTFIKETLIFYTRPTKDPIKLPKTVVLKNVKFFKLLKNYFYSINVTENEMSKLIAHYMMIKTLIEMNFFRQEFKFVSGFKVFTTIKFQALDKKWLCTKLLSENLGSVLTSLVIEKFDIELGGRNKLQNIVDRLVIEMFNMINDTMWMDVDTKSYAQKKLKSMKISLSVSDFQFESLGNYKKRNFYFRNFCAEKDFLTTFLCFNKFLNRRNFELLHRKPSGFDLPTLAFKPNIEYIPDKNMLLVPVGILRPPFFHAYWPPSLNYGGIGSVIASKIIHSFIEGSKYDFNGLHIGFNKSWWSNKTSNNFENRQKQCLTTLNLTNISYLSKLASCVTKNDSRCYFMHFEIVDGVALAYKAYRKYVDTLFLNPETSPGPLSELTHDKEFFLGFSSLYCSERANPEEAWTHIVEDNSKPEDMCRTLTLVSHIPQFRDAFSCEKNYISKALNQCKFF